MLTAGRVVADNSGLLVKGRAPLDMGAHGCINDVDISLRANASTEPVAAILTKPVLEGSVINLSAQASTQWNSVTLGDLCVDIKDSDEASRAGTKESCESRPVTVTSHAQLHDPHIDCRRPIFHVMPARGWASDPSGPIYYKGRYHM